jgi:Ca2+/Na+ antiporter
MNSLKVLTIILIILYILLAIYLLKRIKNNDNDKKNNRIENFVGILEILSDIVDTKEKIEKTNNDIELSKEGKKIIEKEPPKKETKFIYISQVQNNDTLFKYNFYDKNYLMYMILYESIKNYEKNILIKDSKNNIIGNKINEHYNKIIFSLELYKKNIILEYYDNYNYIKIYLENDDKIFTIKNNEIYLYEMKIGKINYNNETSYYKIIVYEEYKTYLSIFGIGLTMTLHN